MDRGGGRVDPAKFPGGLELFRTEGPGDSDLGVEEVSFDPVVAGQMDDFEVRKVMAQALCEPRGRVP